jgi:glycosyltransferase involved in cell wall biosynthesis
VPASYLEVGKATLDRPERVAPWLGWSGSVATHPWDLEQTRGAVAEVLRKHRDWEFHGIGTGVGLAKRLHLEEEQVHHTDGWVTLEEYPFRMAELDLGIVPLEDNTFNRGKSYLKGLEWASLGVPFVATPTSEYQTLHNQGAGWLARRAKDWRRQLDTLMSNRDARMELALRGFEVARGHTYEEHAERWWAVWSGAVDSRRGD